MRTFIKTALLILLSVILISALVEAQSYVDPITDEDYKQWQETNEELDSGLPKKERQLVYAINPFVGWEYADAFAPQRTQTIYLIENIDNIITPRYTDVYYWPITGEYMADWSSYSQDVQAKLEIIKDGKVIDRLELDDYTFYYIGGVGGAQVLVTGEKAVEAYELWEELFNQYLQDSVNYNRVLLPEYDAEVNRITATYTKMGIPIPEDEVPIEPRAPQAPNYWSMPTNKGFAINLPAGGYQIRLVDDAGQVIPDSHKNLVVFAQRREGVGYIMRASDKWTLAFDSNDSSQAVYLNGNQIFYVEAYNSAEFNRYYYMRMGNPHRPLFGQGTEGSWFWVSLGTYYTDPYRLQILLDGKVVQEVSYKPYYVRQIGGGTLGYTIIDYDPTNPDLVYRDPSFYGYKVNLQSDKGSYSMRLVDSDGNVMPGSERVIRLVRDDRVWLLYVIPFLPLVCGLGLFLYRRRLNLKATPAV
jgi:hypothetical protein